MDIRNTIQYYIDLYGGSKTRIVKNTMADRQCKESDVCSSIDWLIKKGFIFLVPEIDLNPCEKRYFESDSCKIYRNIKRFDENEFRTEETKRKESEEKLSNIGKFKLYFSRLEKEFDRKNLYNSKDYKISYSDNSAKIEMEYDKNVISIDFTKVSDFVSDDNDFSFSYKSENTYFTIELFCRWGKCFLQHYKTP